MEKKKAAFQYINNNHVDQKTIKQSHSQYLQNTHRNKANKPIILKIEIKCARRWKDHPCSNTARINIAKMVYYEK
jgi:hypothetical protein